MFRLIVTAFDSLRLPSKFYLSTRFCFSAVCLSTNNSNSCCVCYGSWTCCGSACESVSTFQWFYGWYYTSLIRVRAVPRAKSIELCINFVFVFSKTHFKVHKANLISHSIVFRDMLELTDSTGAKDGGPAQECELTESAEVLEIVLPYLYPEKVKTGFETILPNRTLAIELFWSIRWVASSS